jgi:hypothetical protein
MRSRHVGAKTTIDYPVGTMTSTPTRSIESPCQCCVARSFFLLGRQFVVSSPSFQNDHLQTLNPPVIYYFFTVMRLWDQAVNTSETAPR